MESSELTVVCRWGLGSRSRLRQSGDTMEGQGIAGDTTFRDSDRDVLAWGLGVMRSGM
jgi:hypothetical protein